MRETLTEAIAASGLSARSFAAFLEVDERTVRRWLAGEREVPGPVLVICRAILRDPRIVALLAPSTPVNENGYRTLGKDHR